MKRSDVFMTHYPSGTSIKSIIHWYQLLQKNGTLLTKYDYKKDKNLEIYGQEEPPIYDVENIDSKIPIYFYIGYFDRLGTKPDILKLIQNLTKANIKKKRIYPMGHSSFVWGRELEYFLDDVKDDIEGCECTN